jgi:hypothetical protein
MPLTKPTFAKTTASQELLGISLGMPPVSLQIAENPKKLVFSPGFEKLYPKARLEKDVFDVRVMVQNATKFVWPVLNLNLHHSFDNASNEEYWQAFEKVEGNFKDWRNMVKSLNSFMLLPVDTLVIENSTGAYLIYIDPRWPDGYTVRIISFAITACYLLPTVYVIYPKEFDAKGYMVVRSYNVMSDPDNPQEMDTAEDMANKDYSGSMVYRTGFLAMKDITEGLAVLSTANLDAHMYLLSRKEASKIPQVLRSNYAYHVVDLYRLANEVTSLDGLMNLMNMTNLDYVAKIRDHIGTSRLRRFKDQLFWWHGALRKTNNQQQKENHHE